MVQASLLSADGLIRVFSSWALLPILLGRALENLPSFCSPRHLAFHLHPESFLKGMLQFRKKLTHNTPEIKGACPMLALRVIFMVIYMYVCARVSVCHV